MMSRRLIFWTLFSITAAGLGFYAHVDPGFEKVCRTFFKTESDRLQHMVNTSKTSLKQTTLFASAAREKEAREEALLGVERSKTAAPPPQSKPAAPAKPQPKTAAAPQPQAKPQGQPRPQATSITPPSRPIPQSWEHYSIGQRIAHGHAFARYGFDFGFHSEAEMADHIDRVILHPDASKFTADGRSVYWDEATRSVVILNDYLRDGGTAFKPFDGKAFFDSLK